jgi:hypothetical protein
MRFTGRCFTIFARNAEEIRMGVRSTPELTTDFPVTPSATLQQSIYKFDNLIRAGFLGDYGDVESILPWFGAALVDIEESFAINAPTYTGTAGTTERWYAVVPNYPLPYGVGNAGAANGQYLDFLGGSPPQGYPPASASLKLGQSASGGVSRLYGPLSNVEAVTDMAATLTSANYGVVTTPAKHIPGVLFDIIASTTGNTGPWTVVAIGVAAATVVDDKGAAVSTADPMYGATYTPRAYPEIGIDTTVTPSPGLVVYGSLYRP